MKRLVVSLSALISSIILLIVGSGYLGTLLGLRMSIENVNPSTIGTVLVCYSIGFVVGTLTCNRIILRVGHIRAFAVFASIMAATTLIYPLAIDPVLWAVLRGAGGFCGAGLIMIVESWFSSMATNRNRGTLFAIYQVVFFLSSAGGQFLIMVEDPQRYTTFSLAAILLALAVVPLSMTRLRTPQIDNVERLSFRRIYEMAPTGLGCAFVGGIVMAAFYAMAPVYANQLGFSLTRISTLMVVAVMGAMMLAWPVGWICDRFDRRRVMVVLALLASAAAMMPGLRADLPFEVLLFCAWAFVGLSAALYPVAVAITNDRMETHQIVAASASLLLSYGIGTIVGPVSASALMERLGPGGLFLGCSILLLATALAVILRIARSRDVPVAAQQHFVPAYAETTPAIAEIDPRNEAFRSQWEAESDAVRSQPAAEAVADPEYRFNRRSSDRSPHPQDSQNPSS